MLQQPPSKSELRNTFESVLAAIENGSLSAAPDGTGLPVNVNEALNAVATDRSSRATKIVAARDEFNGWIQTLNTEARNDQFISELFGTN